MMWWESIQHFFKICVLIKQFWKYWKKPNTSSKIIESWINSHQIYGNVLHASITSTVYLHDFRCWTIEFMIILITQRIDCFILFWEKDCDKRIELCVAYFLVFISHWFYKSTQLTFPYWENNFSLKKSRRRYLELYITQANTKSGLVLYKLLFNSKR